MHDSETTGNPAVNYGLMLCMDDLISAVVHKSSVNIVCIAALIWKRSPSFNLARHSTASSRHDFSVATKDHRSSLKTTAFRRFQSLQQQRRTKEAGEASPTAGEASKRCRDPTEAPAGERPTHRQN